MTSDAEDITIIPISEMSLWEKTKQHRTLLSVTLELTARCNNDCVHCYINLPANDADAKKTELATQEIKSLIDEAVSLGALWFLLSGGEPLLRDDFAEIYMYLKKKGVLISLFTNATLITAEHIRLFKKYPPRDIEVTIYGVTPDVYEKVTQRKSLTAAMNGVDQLVNASLPLTLKSTILRSNYKELRQIAQYCRGKSPKPFRFDPFLHLRLDGDAVRNEKIRAERLSPDQIIQLEKRDSTRRAAITKKCMALCSANRDAERTDSLFRCQAGINSCCISCDGRVKLCSALTDEASMYDLKSGDLTDAWKNFVPGIRGMTSEKPSFREKCGSCDIIDICMWCPAHAYLESGKLTEYVKYFCDIAKRREKIFHRGV